MDAQDYNKNSTSYPEILYDELKKLNKDLSSNDSIKTNLFEYQQYVYDYMTKMDVRGVLLYHSVGSGKCMKKDTPILMYDGTIEKIQNIKVGDLIMGDDSTPRKVLSLARGVDKMYDVISNKRSKYTVNKDHILCLKASSYPLLKMNKNGYSVYYIENNNFQVKKFTYGNLDIDESLKNIYFQEAIKFKTTITSPQILEISILDYLQLPARKKKLLKGYKAIIEFDETLVDKPKIDPYALGVWLGDNNTDDFVMINQNSFISEIYNLEIINNKKIPHNYKCTSKQNRLALIAGLLDTAGTYNSKDGYILKIKNIFPNLIDDILFILKSLGYLCYTRLVKSNFENSIFENDNITYTNIYINGSHITDIPTKDFNQIITNIDKDTTSGTRIDVVYKNVDSYYGFTIDKNNRYVLGNFTVTHNTITSISIAEHFRKLNKDIIILSSKSLQNNYKKEISTFSKKLNPDITDEEIESIVSDYKFITSNAKNMIQSLETKNATNNKKEKSSIENMLSNFNTQTLEDKIIIIDEAHNLFNSISNGSKIANEFYEMLMNTKKIKLIFLSGTPIVNDPFEISICFNLLYGPIYTNNNDLKKRKNNKKEYSTILPEYYIDFRKYFIDDPTNNIKNENKFMNRIFGLVSYYGDFYTEVQGTINEELKKTLVKENYPDRLPVIFEVTEMSALQNIEYAKARDTEKKENSRLGRGGKIKNYIYEYKKGAAIVKEKDSTSTSYRIRSRQLSNIFIPTHKEFTKDNIQEFTPKLYKIYENIINNHKDSINLVYSNFLEYGILAFAKILEFHDYKIYDPKEDFDSNYKYYAVFSGKQDLEEKADIIKRINSEENKHGELISILLISKSGVEGLDLKHIRSIHIMEPFFNFSVIQQVIARGVRYKSHIDMPKEEQTVQPYIYLSDYNKEYLESEKIKLKESKQSNKLKKVESRVEFTTDINMLKNSISRQELIYKFLKVIASTSIECPFFNKNDLNYQCFKCIPDDKTLFFEDLQKDMELTNNCTRTAKVSAEEIIINDEKYFYRFKDKDDKDSIEVYKFNETLNGYQKNNNQYIINKILESI